MLEDTNDSKRAPPHIECAVAEEASEEWEGSGEYHLPETVDPVGEALARLGLGL